MAKTTKKSNNIVTKQGKVISIAKEMFLIVNGILHGREGWYDIYPENWTLEGVAGRIKNISGSKTKIETVQSIIEKIALNVSRNYEQDINEFIPCDAPQAFTNFLRTEDYAFINSGSNNVVIPLDKIIEADKSGQYKREIITRMNQMMIQTVKQHDIGSEEDTYIEDGVLVSSSVNKNNFSKLIEEGYSRYRGSYPALGINIKFCDTLREFIDIYKCFNINGKAFLDILKGFAQMKCNPKVLLYFNMTMPDYVETFNDCGTVITFIDNDNLAIMIDSINGIQAITVSKRLIDITRLVDNDMSLLSRMHFNNTGEIVLLSEEDFDVDEEFELEENI